jgi:S-adenosyl-L-methionine hydrolase (adenosine-forming)
VLHIDRFGNLVTSLQWPLPGRGLAPGPSLAIHVGGTRIEGLCRTFSDVPYGSLVAYVGSSQHLEVAVRGGSAAVHLGVGPGDPVTVEGAFACDVAPGDATAGVVEER